MRASGRAHPMDRMMTELKATCDDVRYVYRLLLGREPDEQGLANHLKLLDATSPGPSELARGFFGSREFISRFGCLVKVPAGPVPPHVGSMLRSQACTQYQIESPSFLYWAQRLHERPGGLHRKLWEWCFAAQVLHERGLLRPDARGLGFAVGNEPLTALFASLGAHIVATDLDQAEAAEAGWVESNQHAAGLEQLNDRGLCPADEFRERVRFRNADMRNIADDLRDFDFVWSSCAMEHLGSLGHGVEFVRNAMQCLRPGGIAVHTTELNCDSDTDTIETGGSVVYRQRDLTALARQLRELGHHVEPLDFHVGETEADRYVDEEPYGGKSHIKLRIGPYASTSIGLIVTKGTNIGVRR